jgi:hypothetical protein
VALSDEKLASATDLCGSAFVRAAHSQADIGKSKIMILDQKNIVILDLKRSFYFW